MDQYKIHMVSKNGSEIGDFYNGGIVNIKYFALILFGFTLLFSLQSNARTEDKKGGNNSRHSG